MIRCKRRQRQLYEQECDEAEFQSTFTIPPNELPGTQRTAQLGGSARSISADRERSPRIRPRMRNARPALCVFEPGFDIVDLLESEPDSTDSESVMYDLSRARAVSRARLASDGLVPRDRK